MKDEFKGYVNYYLEEGFLGECIYQTVSQSHNGICKAWGPYLVLKLTQVEDSEPEEPDNDDKEGL